MIEPQPNLPLLKKILEHVDAHPEEWDQEWWFEQTSCGTVACIAGWACILAGDTPQFIANGSAVRVALGDGDGYMAVDLRAVDLLGLTDYEAGNLFDGHNTRADVQRIAEAVALRAGERL